jgi:ABC-type molybdate transport system substrate-binding protein
MLRRLSKLYEMRRFIFVLIFFVGLCLITEIRAQPTHEITISAAISLKNAFENIGGIFQERNPGTRLLLSMMGGSNRLGVRKISFIVRKLKK